jgi:hypothetical protein
VTSDLTILAIADPDFVPRLRALAASIAANMPSATLHACLVNVVDPDLAQSIERAHARTEISFVFAELDATVVRMGLDGVTPYTEKAGFCVNLRGRAVLDLLREGRGRVLFLDADSIVRRDLGSLFPLIDANDVVIHLRPHERDFMGVAGGVIGVRPSAGAIEFFERAVERIDAIGNRAFFSDQLAFHQTIAEMGASLRVAHLPKVFIDWDFDPRSFIWVGKGRRKFENAAYIEEERLYHA